jgi:uncharacterized linocin/CFP29 family protein
MDFLKRQHAPITEKAWEFIDSEARRIFRTALRARRFVDVIGPKGWEFSAVNLGRIEIAGKEAKESQIYGMRTVLPLVELRIPFVLDLWEMDNLSRGAVDVDVDALHEAARGAARFEDTAVLKGFSPAGITGLADSSDHEIQEMQLEAGAFLDILSGSVLRLRDVSIEGPYALVVGSETFRFLARAQAGYPLLRRVERLLEGPVVESDILTDEGFLLSTRGGDFELTLGQDLSIGYEHHDSKQLRLFITETFTFRNLEPNGVAKLKLVD